jgi:quinol monooxygenase YgiN
LPKPALISQSFPLSLVPVSHLNLSLEKRRKATRTFVIAILALLALSLRAEAQTAKPAVGSDQVYWMLTVTVDKMDEFKSLIKKLVAATEKEPGALQYEYNVGDDQKTVDVYERYADSKAALFHLGETFGPNFSKEFFALTKPTRFVIYGTPTDEFKKAVTDFHPIYMTPVDGFTR